MKDIHKNPIFYYVLAPVVAICWLASVAMVSLPKAEVNWQKQTVEYDKAQKIIAEILKINPERLTFADLQAGKDEFDYAVAVEKIAGLCDIKSSNYKLSSGIRITSGGQKSQSANVLLRETNITKFAKFLSTIQLHWPNLQCTQLKLTYKKGLTDIWDADLKLKYFY